METLKVNETPLRTSRNFNINNIKLENVTIPSQIGNFENVTIINESSNIKVEHISNQFDLKYGLGNILEKQVKESSNQTFNIVLEGKSNEKITLQFDFDEDNLNLVENIQITAKENTRATVLLSYKSLEEVEAFHNGILKVIAKKGASLHVIFMNLFNTRSHHFMSIENELEENAKVDYTIIDFGGKNSITNYYAQLIGKNAQNIIHTIYLGKDKQLFDLNYIAELFGEETNVAIEVQGYH